MPKPPALLLAALLATGAACATAAPRLYRMTTETGMPHLEENLRYAMLHEQRCLDPQDLSAAFWMLKHESLQDCRLEQTMHDDSAARYALRCDGGHGTSGSAEWQLGSDALRGVLNVKLGGKNMTFYQRIVATPLGSCEAR